MRHVLDHLRPHLFSIWFCVVRFYPSTAIVKMLKLYSYCMHTFHNAKLSKCEDFACVYTGLRCFNSTEYFCLNFGVFSKKDLLICLNCVRSFACMHHSRNFASFVTSFMFVFKLGIKHSWYTARTCAIDYCQLCMEWSRWGKNKQASE